MLGRGSSEWSCRVRILATSKFLQKQRKVNLKLGGNGDRKPRRKRGRQSEEEQREGAYRSLSLSHLDLLNPGYTASPRVTHSHLDYKQLLVSKPESFSLSSPS